jgi:hypothetical protein
MRRRWTSASSMFPRPMRSESRRLRPFSISVGRGGHRRIARLPTLGDLKDHGLMIGWRTMGRKLGRGLRGFKKPSRLTRKTAAQRVGLIKAISLLVAPLRQACVLISSAAVRLILASPQFGVGSGPRGRPRKWYPATNPGRLRPDAERQSVVAASTTAARRVGKRAADSKKCRCCGRHQRRSNHSLCHVSSPRS